MGAGEGCRGVRRKEQARRGFVRRVDLGQLRRKMSERSELKEDE